MECYYCKSAISDNAIKCRYCGGWISRDGSLIYSAKEHIHSDSRQITPVPPPRPPSVPPPFSLVPPPLPPFENQQPIFHPVSNQSVQQNVHITANNPESPLFAIITLILYLFSPIGGISGIIAFFLNIVGLITGPKRGCFVQLLVFFVIIPGVIIIFLLVLAKDLLEDLLDNFSDILPF
jgi:hypothetical protein